MVAGVVELLQRLDRLVRGGGGRDIEAVELAGELTTGIVLVVGHLGAGDAGVRGLDIYARGGSRLIADLTDVADRHRISWVRRLRDLDVETAVRLLVGGRRFCRRRCGRWRFGGRWRAGGCRYRGRGLIAGQRLEAGRERQEASDA